LLQRRNVHVFDFERDHVDPAAERRDVGDQPLERGVDQPLHAFRIEVFRQRRVADEIGEHDRDDAALLVGERHDFLAARRAETGAIREREQARGARGHQPVIVRHIHLGTDHCSAATR